MKPIIIFLICGFSHISSASVMYLTKHGAERLGIVMKRESLGSIGEATNLAAISLEFESKGEMANVASLELNVYAEPPRSLGILQSHRRLTSATLKPTIETKEKVRFFFCVDSQYLDRTEITFRVKTDSVLRSYSMWLDPKDFPPPAKNSIAGKDAKMPYIAELPRPNSGTFTFAQAEAKKHLVLQNLPSSPLMFNAPRMDFAVHVMSNDTFCIYSVSSPLSGEIEKQRPANLEDIKKAMDSIPLDGRQLDILVTSDKSLHESIVIKDLLKVIFVPRVQLYYLSEK